VKATRNARIDSMMLSWDFGITVASPFIAARAAASASTVSDLPRQRRICRFGRLTSSTSTCSPVRKRKRPAP
jgi:hypothetical protein